LLKKLIIAKNIDKTVDWFAIESHYLRRAASSAAFISVIK